MSTESASGSNRLAVLIDAENANADLIESLLKEIAKYGVAHVKRIYGDWTTPQLGKWKEKLNKFAIQPIQQFRYTSGKNSTDIALIIDAMDLLYTRTFEGFCLISSDSDFTRLASRIREDGLFVYGFGEKKTPEAFISACDKFIYTEILENTENSTGISTDSGSAHGIDGKEIDGSRKSTSQAEKGANRQKLVANKKLVQLLKDAYEAVADEDGWANLGAYGSQLNKLSPSFDSRNYDYKKLGDLIRAIDLFEIKVVPHGKNPAAKSLHIKLKT